VPWEFEVVESIQWLFCGGRALFLLVTLIGSIDFCRGQNSDTSSSASQQSSLVDGLLELIEPPQRPQWPGDASGKDIGQSVEVRSPSEADISENEGIEANSLLGVRLLMMDVLAAMRRGTVGRETIDLQDDILKQLDALIEMLARPRGAEETDKGQPQELSQIEEGIEERLETQAIPDQVREESSQFGQESAASEDAAGESDQATTENLQEPTSVGIEGGVPGQGQAYPGGDAQPVDPGQLQRGVWGHLPDQIKSQLQARMAEQFLPTYREQLEAYYRALLSREKP
jgi:hypothetical protein